MNWIKRLFCRHPKVWLIRNVYGDEINLLNCRSLWMCADCGAHVRKNQLHNSGKQT